MKNFVSYVQFSKEELLKVIFPTKEQVRSAFFAVFILVTVVSLFLALIDLIMSSLLSVFL